MSAPKGQTRFLVRRATADVFIWSETLSKRKDMEEVWADSPKAALERDTLPDPHRITLEQLEGMKKADVIVFAKVKLNLDLGADMRLDDMLDEVKLAIFNRPVKSNQADDSVKPAATSSRPLSSAAAARSQAGM